MTTFEGIPTTICNAEKCCEFCPTDESLQHEVMELYIAVLLAIMDMMEWLVEKGGCKSSCAARCRHQPALLMVGREAN